MAEITCAKIEMGMTRARVRIEGPKGSRVVELTVDTGSEDTWIDGRILEEIGIEPRLSRTYRTITGERVVRKVAPVEIECLGVKMPCPTVFAEENDANVLGAAAFGDSGPQSKPPLRTSSRWSRP